ncbi:hypothetical protein KP806_24095 [Paenibacillus sp. N4]|uniref:hypothetical protein n=1 Tax=Paenibacillus vietnamensis TaxID=2590547 RepID=UPI001CD06583|nr:hypothetical protein [Paenibacillus vietnamensis]MCA0758143.1 hypothetical protein [Paenibacillus vietnamensis]
MKQISAQLELHINTIYAWNKKLSSFFELYLPNKQFQTFEQTSHDYATIEVKCSNQEETLRNSTNQSQHLPYKDNITLIPVLVAVNRENPSHIHFVSGDHLAVDNKTEPEKSAALIKVISEFRDYLANKRRITAPKLNQYLTYFRMLKLIQAINPAILPSELFKLCLDKGNLSRSKRLLKRLI